MFINVHAIIYIHYIYIHTKKLKMRIRLINLSFINLFLRAKKKKLQTNVIVCIINKHTYKFICMRIHFKYAYNSCKNNLTLSI